MLQNPQPDSDQTSLDREQANKGCIQDLWKGFDKSVL